MSTQIFNFNFVKEEHYSVIKVLVYCQLSSPDDVQFTGSIAINDSIVQTGGANLVLDNQYSNGRIPLSLFAFVTGLGAGVHNAKFVMWNNELDNVNLVVEQGATIEVTELKQGAL